jgi:hypothetical protein
MLCIPHGQILGIPRTITSPQISSWGIRNVSTGFIRVVQGQQGINSLRILQTMSFKSEAGADGKQPAELPDVTVEQPLSPAPSSNTEITVGDKRHHVAIDKPLSVFTLKEKWSIIILASCAAIFRRVRYIVTHVFYFADARSLNSHISPFTANIYFPAIPVISADFHKSVELINLTVTVYMVMQGLCTPLPL